MQRYKALSALAFFAVLISAGSVGSQDPFRARSEAESAERAQPIWAPEFNGPSNPYSQFEPAPVRAPLVITPGALPVVEPEAAAPVKEVPQPLEPVAEAEGAARVQLAAVVSPAAPGSLPVPPVNTEVAVGESDGPLFPSAARRLFETVPNEIESYYDLFMYVSKSNRGPFGQRMFVFQRDQDGKIIPYAEWRVSTGREKIELHHEKKIRTTTPEGIFQFDPNRMHERYFSRSWDGAPMHHAMFYDLKNNGNLSGLAIHAAVGASKIRRLGKRDSAGCIRLSPKNAAELFYKIRNTTKGRVPAFAVNERGSTDRWGRVEVDASGAPVLQDGYRAVLLVENYDGRDEIAGSVVAYTN
jgi:lipoprotein-anchoring transpeptidase ErfK/SrfK